MTFGWPQLFALVVVVTASVVAFTADDRVRRRHPERDSGDFWAVVLSWLCVLSGCGVLLYGLSASLIDYLPPAATLWPYQLWLTLPWVAWLLMLWLADRKVLPNGRWIAGSISFKPNRYWLCFFLIPLAFPLSFGLFRLGPGRAAYPAGIWSTALAIELSILLLALSNRTAIQTMQDSAKSEEQPVVQLKEWAAEMKNGGIELAQLVEWKKSPATRMATIAQEWEQWLRLCGSRNIAPEILDVGWRLIAPSPTEPEPVQLILAADNCGQEEVTALLGAELSQRFGEVTLIVTPAPEPGLPGRLRRWIDLGDNQKGIGITQLTINTPALSSHLSAADIWVTDADTLSDRVLDELARNHSLVDRIGLIVWWDVHTYTGILAANVWAISRRLQRMLKAFGSLQVRVLAFARTTRYGNAGLRQFIQHMLGYKFDEQGHYVEIAIRIARNLYFYRLVGDQKFRQNEATGIQPKFLLLPLTAARVSVERNWPTWLKRPMNISVDEETGMLDTEVRGRRMREWMAPDPTVPASEISTDPTTAGAEIRTLGPGDVLSLREKYASGGRSAVTKILPEGDPHHVAFIVDDNPYVSYLAARLAESSPALQSSRFLVGAEGHLKILQRHMVSALQELKDTKSRLTDAFRDARIINETLDELQASHLVDLHPIRYLNQKNDLQRDFVYTSRLAGQAARRPLSTVGSDLVRVQVSAGAIDDTSTRLEVDPERIAIAAYPMRVFFYDGQRYRIRMWDNPSRILKEKSLLCSAESVFGVTWRRRIPRVRSMMTGDDRASRSIGAEGDLILSPVNLEYSETVVGYLERANDGTIREHQFPRVIESPPFQTRGLVLKFDSDQAGPSSLCTVAAVLRHLLPVHVGVADDAIEVMAVQDDGKSNFSNLVLVDLFPGGIGLVDAMYADANLIENLLKWSLEWLLYCAKDSAGHSAFLKSPLKRGVITAEEISIEPAITLLRHLFAGPETIDRAARSR